MRHGDTLGASGGATGVTFGDPGEPLCRSAGPSGVSGGARGRSGRRPKPESKNGTKRKNEFEQLREVLATPALGRRRGGER